MTITEALKITQSAPREAPPFTVVLACGFTPLHLQTFLAAHLQRGLTGRKVTVAPGLFGDLVGTLEGLTGSASPDALAIALEWSDLDPRLGYRSAGSWSLAAANDIAISARAMLERITAVLAKTGFGPAIALSLPTLPLPPLFHTPGWQASANELTVNADVQRFAAHIAELGRVAVVNPRRLAEASPMAGRFDLKSDVYNGLPYTMHHADRLASQLALAIAPPAAKKGVISDLDDTLWDGILGEVGAEAVAWDLAGHAQLHGLYQKLLASLVESGTLVGIASKNDPAMVAAAFERKDMLLRPEQVYPIEVHWNAKSGSVTRILEAWNIAADSVIFVDDSPMELAEVAAVHPGIECVLFPKNDYQAGLSMLRHLRDCCGKERVSQDDTLRLESIRQSAVFREQASEGSAPESFLQQLGAVMTFDFAAGGEPRVLELVNKTNQFNLNGMRYTESDWRKLISAPDAVLAAVSYEDKFGPLGTIAAIAGHFVAGILTIDTWVLSCRAFARRIEHQTLKTIFDCTGARQIEFSFAATVKNGPLRNFFTSLSGEEPQGDFILTRAQFEAKCPALYHEVRQMRRAEAHG